MTETGVATQDDFKEINEEVKLRELTQPLRYLNPHLTGSFVSAEAFDNIRDAYIKAVQPTYLDKCSICGGDVNTAQQFIRIPVSGGDAFPILVHLICDERLQARCNKLDADLLAGKVRYQAVEIAQLRDVILRVQQALGNFPNLLAEKVIEEANYATSKRQEQGRNISEHPFRGDSGQTTEAGNSNSFVESRQGSSKTKPTIEASEGPMRWSDAEGKWITVPYSFSVDDVAAGDYKPVVHKWPVEFKQFKESVGPSCKSDPLGCSSDDQTLEHRYALEKPSSHEFIPNTSQIVSCCE